MGMAHRTSACASWTRCRASFSLDERTHRGFESTQVRGMLANDMILCAYYIMTA